MNPAFDTVIGADAETRLGLFIASAQALPAIGFPAHLWGLEDTVRGLRSEEIVDCSSASRLRFTGSRKRHATFCDGPTRCLRGSLRST